MSGADRKPYVTATTIDQSFLDFCHDNMTNQLEMVAEIRTPTGAGFLTDKIYVSDRKKYVGQHFYEARVNFPVLKRSIGEFLSPSVTFPDLKLTINNSDGKFNSILPGGQFFDQMVGKEVTVKLGLRDVESTYQTIFFGAVTEIGGLSRDVSSFSIVARDRFDILRTEIPGSQFNTTNYPNIEESLIGEGTPIIYGDWTVELTPNQNASIPAYPVNGADANVLAGTTNVQCIISQISNLLFDNTSVVLVRGDQYYPFDSADITNIIVGNKGFEVIQNNVTLIDGSPYIFQAGDIFYCRVKGKDLGAYSDNAVAIARDLLDEYAGLSAGDFHSSWNTIRDKVIGGNPADSVANIKARIWIKDSVEVLTLALSLLEQVRVECFVNKAQQLQLSTLHFSDMVANPPFVVRQWDIERNSLKPTSDLRNNINKAKGFFNYLPDQDDNFYRTNFFINQNSVNQVLFERQKGLVFPNLYIRSDVDNQTKETLKLTSSFFETIEVNQTWRSLLLEISDWVQMDFSIGSTVFEGVPCLVRDIGYSVVGLKLVIKYWSFQTIPFPLWPGQGGGLVGGNNATIIELTT
jgi:hypothetical protein